MTTSNNHETISPKRPVKEWYTLDELARAWSVEFQAEFTKEYLMELASQPGRILTLGVIAHDWFFYRYDQGKHKDNPHFELLNGFTNLSVHTVKELISAESTAVDWIADCNGGTRCHVCTLGSQKSNVLCGRRHQDLIIPDGPVMFLPLINRHDLKVSDEERIRYEKLLRAQPDSASEDSVQVVDIKTNGVTNEVIPETFCQELINHPAKFTLAESELTLEPLVLSPSESACQKNLELALPEDPTTTPPMPVLNKSSSEPVDSETALIQADLLVKLNSQIMSERGRKGAEIRHAKSKAMKTEFIEFWRESGMSRNRAAEYYAENNIDGTPRKPPLNSATVRIWLKGVKESHPHGGSPIPNTENIEDKKVE